MFWNRIWKSSKADLTALGKKTPKTSKQKGKGDVSGLGQG